MRNKNDKYKIIAITIAIPIVIGTVHRWDNRVKVRAAPTLEKAPIRRHLKEEPKIKKVREFPKPYKSEFKDMEPASQEELGDDDLKEFLGETSNHYNDLWGNPIDNKANSMVKDYEVLRKNEQIAKNELKQEKINALKDKIAGDLEKRENLIKEMEEERERFIAESNRRYEEDRKRLKQTQSQYNKPDLFIIDKALTGDNTYLAKSINKMMPSYIGKPYVWGGDDRTTGGTGYDCSGFTLSVMNQLGYTKLPRVSSDQFKKGKEISIQDLRPGDLVFFDTKRSINAENKRVSHVGLYIGRGLMVHASSGSNRIRTEQVFSDYFAPRYMGARRYIN